MLQGRITNRQLELARPNHWASPKTAPNRPNYTDEHGFNFNSKCPNFRVLFHNNVPLIGSNGYPATVPCLHEDPKACQFDASSIYTFARLIQIKVLSKRDFVKFGSTSWATTINNTIQASPQGDVRNVFSHQSLWPRQDDMLWSPVDLLGMRMDTKFRFVIPPLGLYSYNVYQTIEKDEYGLMVPNAAFDTVYNLEFQLTRIHFTLRNRYNSLFTGSVLDEKDEFFTWLDEIISGYNDIPEPEFNL